MFLLQSRQGDANVVTIFLQRHTHPIIVFRFFRRMQRFELSIPQLLHQLGFVHGVVFAVKPLLQFAQRLCRGHHGGRR